MQQEKEELVGSKLMAVFKECSPKARECSPKARKRLVMLYRFICRKDNKLMIKDLHLHIHFEDNRDDVENMFFDNHGPLNIKEVWQKKKR